MILPLPKAEVNLKRKTVLKCYPNCFKWYIFELFGCTNRFTLKTRSIFYPLCRLHLEPKVKNVSFRFHEMILFSLQRVRLYISTFLETGVSTCSLAGTHTPTYISYMSKNNKSLTTFFSCFSVKQTKYCIPISTFELMLYK